MKYKKSKVPGIAAVMTLTVAMMSGCSDSESYSDLLRDEMRAVNWYLAQEKVETAIPADSIFETGADAPFYRMDDDGTVYMQVVTAGDKNKRPVSGEKVYFRFSRRNIKLMYEGGAAPAEGNSDNLNNAVGATYFFYGNKIYPTTVQFGTGIQLPMDYMGYNTEVNLVLKSYSGFTQDQSSCVPYIVNVKYYKAEY